MEIFSSFSELAIANGAPENSMYVRGPGRMPTKNYRQVLDHFICPNGNDFFIFFEPDSGKYGWDSSIYEGSGAVYHDYQNAYKHATSQLEEWDVCEWQG